MFLNKGLTLSYLFINGIFQELPTESKYYKKFDLKRIVGNHSIQPVSFTHDETDIKSKQVAQSHPTSLSLNEDARGIPCLFLMLFLVYSMQSLSKYKLSRLDIYMILGKV